MRTPITWSFVVVLAALNLGIAPEKALETEVMETATRSAGDRHRPSTDAYDLISADSLMKSLGELTSLGAHDGWRHSTSQGEAEAIGYMQKRLAKMGFLRSLGLEVEIEEFRTYMGVRFHKSRVHFLINGEEHEVPADAIPGHRESLDLALRFDSDGQLNDSDPDPKMVTGPPLVVRSPLEIQDLRNDNADLGGRIILLDYAAIDRVVNDRVQAIQAATSLAQMQPAGIVMITTYSNQRGLSHGSFAGDLSAFTWAEVDPMPPVLLVRSEDMAEIGINGW